MLTFSSIVLFMLLRFLLLLVAPTSLVEAVPFVSSNSTNSSSLSPSNYWVANIKRQGSVAFGDASFKVYRNVRDYGAVGKSCLVLDFEIHG